MLQLHQRAPESQMNVANTLWNPCQPVLAWCSILHKKTGMPRGRKNVENCGKLIFMGLCPGLKPSFWICKVCVTGLISMGDLQRRGAPQEQPRIPKLWSYWSIGRKGEEEKSRKKQDWELSKCGGEFGEDVLFYAWAACELQVQYASA